MRCHVLLLLVSVCFFLFVVVVVVYRWIWEELPTAQFQEMFGPMCKFAWLIQMKLRLLLHALVREENAPSALSYKLCSLLLFVVIVLLFFLLLFFWPVLKSLSVVIVIQFDVFHEEGVAQPAFVWSYLSELQLHSVQELWAHTEDCELLQHIYSMWLWLYAKGNVEKLAIHIEF